jgi:Flp pilus assembly protein TadD
MQAIEVEETAETWYRVGITKVRLDDDSFAWKAFNQALHLDPDHAPSLEEMGLLYIGLGEPAEATTVLTRAIELDNTRWRAYNALGVLADIDKRYDDAVKLYKAALQAKPKTAMLMNNIGYSYYLAGNLQEATNWLDAAVQAQRNYEPAIKNLALLYARQGWYEEAVETFITVVDEPRAYNDVGYVALRNGDLEAATELLTEAIRLSPVYYEKAYENLALVRAELERLKRSEKTAALAGNMSEIVFPDAHEKQTRNVMPQALNVRSAPSPNAEIVEYLRTGDTVEIVVTQPGWAFINYDTRSGGTITGWVNTRFLTGIEATEVNEQSDTESGNQLIVDEKLDTSKTSEKLGIDENLSATKPSEPLIIETNLGVDAAQAYNNENLSAVNPPGERMILDEKMNVVALDVSQAYQAAPAAETAPTP